MFENYQKNTSTLITDIKKVVIGGKYLGALFYNIGIVELQQIKSQIEKEFEDSFKWEIITTEPTKTSEKIAKELEERTNGIKTIILDLLSINDPLPENQLFYKINVEEYFKINNPHQ